MGQSTPIPEEDIGRGVDQFHPEHRLPPGFIEDARNFDPTPWGTLRKRVGYQLFAGFLPLRVATIARTGNLLTLVFDVPSGCFSSLRSSPLLLTGRVGAAAAGWSQTALSAAYYAGFIVVSSTSLQVVDFGTDFATTAFEGSAHGIDCSLLDFSAATNPSYSTHIDHLDHFQNSLYQHPVCGFRGVFHAAQGSPHVGSFPSSTPTATIPVAPAAASFTFVPGDVNTGTDTITHAAHGMTTGQIVAFSGGTPPPGISPSGTISSAPRFVIRTGANTFKLATTHANAVAGTAINITSAGTGTFTALPGISLGPLFWETATASPARSRGYIVGTDLATGWAPGHSIAFNPVSGWVEYTLTVAGMAMRAADGTTVTDPATLVSVGKDVLSVRDASYGVLNGDFVIQAIAAPTATTLRVAVAIPAIDVADAASLPDTTGSADFRAGVFTDLLQSTIRGLLGASLSIDSLPESDLWNVVASTPSGPYVSGVNEERSFFRGNVFTETVTMSVILLSATAGWVRGDTLWTPGLAPSRRVRVQNVLPISGETAVSVSGDGTTAGFTNGTLAPVLSEGDLFLVVDAGSVDGVHVVDSVVGNTVFFLSPFLGTTSAVVMGSTLGLSEAIEFSGAAPVQVLERWIPIEGVPRATTLAPNQTYLTYYTRGDTSTTPPPKIRSVMAGSAMYLTNGVTTVYKYDGQYLSAAGLPRFAPLTGVSTLSNRSTGVVNPDQKMRLIDEAAAPTNGKYKLVVDADGTTPLHDFDTTGTEITYSVRPGTDLLYEYPYVVSGISEKSTDTGVTADSVQVNDPRAPAFDPTGDFFRISFARRYFVAFYRRDPLDQAAVTSPFHLEDAAVRFGADHRPDLLVQSMPNYFLYDYRRVEAQVGLSLGSAGDPSFVTGGILPQDYTAIPPTRVFQDSIQPADAPLHGKIENTALDILESVFEGPALRVGLDRPPLAKCVTSAADRLALGNIVSYPRMTISAVIPAGATATPQKLLGQTFTLAPAFLSPTRTYEYLSTVVGGSTLSASVNVAVARVTDMDGTYITLTMTSTFATMAHPIPNAAVGNWIQVSHQLNTLISSNTDPFLLGWFRILTISGDQVITVAAPHRAKALITAVDTGADLLTVAAHGLSIGDPVRFTAGGTLPTGLSATVQYYARPTSVDQFAAYDTYAHAYAGGGTGKVNLTSAGVAPFYVMFVEHVDNLSIAFASVRDNTHVPVLISDVAVSVGTIPFPYIDTEDRNRTVGDKIPAKYAAFNLCLRELGKAINAVAAHDSFVPVAGATSLPGVFCAGFGSDASTMNSIDLESFTDIGFTATIPAVSFPQWYADGSLASGVTSSRTLQFPSRIARSYHKFPEIFDQPFVKALSDSTIEVGEADGDEITAMIQRYGESFSNSALGQGALIVFKRRSVYLVDINTRQVAQIETNGQGSPYGRSVIRTKNGIEFANESGLWKINEGNQCVFLGQILTRYWERTVNRDPSISADVICGHHDAARNRTYMSVPIGSDTATSEIAAYDHTRENSNDRGSWTLYDNFDVTWWSNAGSDSLFGTTTGRVHALRRAFDASDYQDDVDPVGGLDETGSPNGAYVLFGEKDFGAPGIRKRVNDVSIGFRSDDGTAVSSDDSIVTAMAIDHSEVFIAMDTFSLSDPAAGDADSLSGQSRGNVTTLNFSPVMRKAEYVQLRISDGAVSRCVEITDVAYLVEALTDRGVPTASETRTGR